MAENTVGVVKLEVLHGFGGSGIGKGADEGLAGECAISGAPNHLFLRMLPWIVDRIR